MVKTISKHTEPQWVHRVAFANIFMSAVETEILKSAKLNLLSGRDTLTVFFSLWRTERKEIYEFIALANRHHPSIKFTAKNM